MAKAKPRKPRMGHVNIFLDATTLARVRDLAKREDRSVSSILRILIHVGLANSFDSLTAASIKALHEEHKARIKESEERIKATLA